MAILEKSQNDTVMYLKGEIVVSIFGMLYTPVTDIVLKGEEYRWEAEDVIGDKGITRNIYLKGI